MAFLLRKYKNEYYLENTGVTSSTYSIQLAGNCCTCETNSPSPVVDTLLASEEKLLALTIDGIYVVNVPGTGTPTDTFTINYFPKLETRIVSDVKAFLCGDNCVECGNSVTQARVENLSQYQNIFNEVITYHLLKGYEGPDEQCQNCKRANFIYRAANLYSCDIQKELCIQVNSTDFFGRFTGSLELFSKFVSIYYLGFYFEQFFSASDESEEQYIDDLYDICEIKRCMRKFGIDFEELKELYQTIQEEAC